MPPGRIIEALDEVKYGHAGLGEDTIRRRRVQLDGEIPIGVPERMERVGGGGGAGGVALIDAVEVDDEVHGRRQAAQVLHRERAPHVGVVAEHVFVTGGDVDVAEAAARLVQAAQSLLCTPEE